MATSSKKVQVGGLRSGAVAASLHGPYLAGAFVGMSGSDTEADPTFRFMMEYVAALNVKEDVKAGRPHCSFCFTSIDTINFGMKVIPCNGGGCKGKRVYCSEQCRKKDWTPKEQDQQDGKKEKNLQTGKKNKAGI
jgi:hypothetical protein